jgi:MSHA biogenesis protein MshI
MELLALFWKKPDERVRVALCPLGRDLVAVAVRQEPGRAPQLEWCHHQPNVEPSALPVALRRLMRQHPIRHHPVTTLLPMDLYRLLLLEAADVPDDELAEAMQWRLRGLLDFPVEEAVVEVFPVPTQRSLAKRMVYTVAARTEVLRGHIAPLLDAGLSLTEIDIPELALRNLATLLPDSASGTVLLYLAAGQGIVLVIRQGILYIARRFFYSEWELGTADRPGTGGDNGLAGIVYEVQRSVEYYEEFFDGAVPPLAGIVIVPPDEPIPQLPEMLAARTHLATRYLDLATLIDGYAACLLAPGNPGRIAQAPPGKLCLALGAALGSHVAWPMEEAA